MFIEWKETSSLAHVVRLGKNGAKTIWRSKFSCQCDADRFAQRHIDAYWENWQSQFGVRPWATFWWVCLFAVFSYTAIKIVALSRMAVKRPPFGNVSIRVCRWVRQAVQLISSIIIEASLAGTLLPMNSEQITDTLLPTRAEEQCYWSWIWKSQEGVNGNRRQWMQLSLEEPLICIVHLAADSMDRFVLFLGHRFKRIAKK